MELQPFSFHISPSLQLPPHPFPSTSTSFLPTLLLPLLGNFSCPSRRISPRIMVFGLEGTLRLPTPLPGTGTPSPIPGCRSWEVTARSTRTLPFASHDPAFIPEKIVLSQCQDCPGAPNTGEHSQGMREQIPIPRGCQKLSGSKTVLPRSLWDRSLHNSQAGRSSTGGGGDRPQTWSTPVGATACPRLALELAPRLAAFPHTSMQSWD